MYMNQYISMYNVMYDTQYKYTLYTASYIRRQLTPSGCAQNSLVPDFEFFSVNNQMNWAKIEPMGGVLNALPASCAAAQAALSLTVMTDLCCRSCLLEEGQLWGAKKMKINLTVSDSEQPTQNFDLLNELIQSNR